jgi:hypothetical protein
MEENMTSTLVVETIKTQALELNERFATEQKEFLNLLGNIQTGREEQLRLQDKLVEIQGRYQESHEALEKMLSWQDMCETPPTTLPVYSIEKDSDIRYSLTLVNPFSRMYRSPKRKQLMPT